MVQLAGEGLHLQRGGPYPTMTMRVGSAIMDLGLVSEIIYQKRTPESAIAVLCFVLRLLS